MEEGLPPRKRSPQEKGTRNFSPPQIKKERSGPSKKMIE
jgi:hypothetical protein